MFYDVPSMGKLRSTYRTLAGKPEGKRPHGRHEDNESVVFKMGARRVGVWVRGVD
jgi:hypothetical protein